MITEAPQIEACPQSPGGGQSKNGNGPDSPRKRGRPARGFWGAGKSVAPRAAGFLLALALVLLGDASLAQGSAQSGPAPAAPAAPGQSTTTPYKPEHKLSIAVGPAYAWGKGADHWAQLIKERTAGRIVIRQFPGASATGGDPLQEFVGLQQGSIDFAVGSSMNWAGYIKPLNVFALPFLVADTRALDAMLRGDVGGSLFRAIEEKGVIPLAWGDHEMHAISMSQRPVRGADDIKGARLRVTGSTPVEETLRALGATPVRLRSTDAQNALLGGTIDGQEITPQAFMSTKAHTLNQKHLTLWAMAAEPLIFAVSRAAWDTFSQGDRDIVRQAAIDAAKRQIEWSRSATQTAISMLGREYKEAGVQVIRPSAEQRAALMAATRGVYDKWAKEIGNDIVRQAEEAAAPERAAGALNKP